MQLKEHYYFCLNKSSNPPAGENCKHLMLLNVCGLFYVKKIIIASEFPGYKNCRDVQKAEHSSLRITQKQEERKTITPLFFLLFIYLFFFFFLGGGGVKLHVKLFVLTYSSINKHTLIFF